MTYTAKQLGDLSGVSIRTLHWYDKIGLLKPSSYGENGYRYYEREQLLFLQQILFFRELDFKLDEIKDILGREDFDQVKTLESHRKKLTEKAHRIKTLIKTVDLTISDLNGKKQASDQELYHGFYEWIKDQDKNAYALVKAKDDPKDPLYEAEQIMGKSLKQVDRTNWTKEDYQQLSDRGNAIFATLKKMLEKGVSPLAANVQKVILKHYKYTSEFHHLTPHVYKALATLHRFHPDFRKQLELHHPELPEFMAKSMMYFAKQQTAK